MPMGKRAVIAMLTSLVAGCSSLGSSETVYLKNSKTGNTAECGGYKLADVGGPERAQQFTRWCVEDYKAGGYVQTAAPSD